MHLFDDKSRRYGRTKLLRPEELRECFRDPELEGVKYAVLFGSRAAGSATARSDYDLAVYGTGEYPWGLQSAVWDTLTRRCGVEDCDLDVVDLRRAGAALLGSVAEAYVMLKGEKDEFSRLLAQLRANRTSGGETSRRVGPKG